MLYFQVNTDIIYLSWCERSQLIFKEYTQNCQIALYGKSLFYRALTYMYVWIICVDYWHNNFCRLLTQIIA